MSPGATTWHTRDAMRGATRVWRRLHFGKATRAETWQLVADVLEAGQGLNEVLDTLAGGYAMQGRGAVAAVLGDLREGLRQNALQDRLRPYTGLAERVLFEGIGGKADAAGLFRGAARVLRMELAIGKALMSAIAMPILLLFGLLALMLFFGYKLLPALGEIVDFGTMPALQKTVIDITLALSGDPAALALWIAGITGVLAILLRAWTGPGRSHADRVPPFSLMRLQAGAGFLFAVVEYGRAGEDITTRLFERIAAAAPPYARSRIRAVAREYEGAGGNLGTAALKARQGFPAVELSVVLQMLWNTEGGIERIGAFLERWMARVEDRVRASMAVLNAVLLTLVAGVLVALLSIMMPVFAQLNQGAGM